MNYQKMAVYLRKLTNEFHDEIKEMMIEELSSAKEYIKQLEQRINELEEEKEKNSIVLKEITIHHKDKTYVYTISEDCETSDEDDIKVYDEESLYIESSSEESI